MAIYHCNLSYISRKGPGSVSSHIAYITASRIIEERTGLAWDYTGKGQEVLAVFTLTPEGSPEWVHDKQELCNRIEKHVDQLAEKRFRGHADPDKNERSFKAKKEFKKKAITLYKANIALPIEIDKPEHLLEVSKRLAQECYVSRGFTITGAIHNKEGNPHLHIAATIRPLVEGEFANRIPLTKDIVKEIRKQVADVLNTFGQEKGYDYHVDHRSYKDQGKRLIASKHLGPNAQHRLGERSRIAEENEEIRQKNIEIILKHPEEIIKSVASQKSVFTKTDLEREIFKRVDGDDALCGILKMRLDGIEMHSAIGSTANENQIYESKNYRNGAKETVDAFATMLLSQKETAHVGQNVSGHSVYTSQRYKDLETYIESSLLRLKDQKSKGINAIYKVGAILNIEAEKKIEFSQTQKEAIDHLLSNNRIAVLTGRAGTGKTTVLKPVVQAYKRSGYTIFGAALQGKVADMLARDLGVERFTLDQLKRRWRIHEALTKKIESGELRGMALQQAMIKVLRYQQFRLTKKHVLIVDEVNMVSGHLWQALLKEVEQSGATLRLVGDNNQIKAFFDGDFGRMVEERVGSFTLQTVVRQNIDWMRTASEFLNNHQMEEGLKPYIEHGKLAFKESIHSAKYAVVADYVNFYKRAKATGKTHIALAFQNKDVEDLNHAIHNHLIHKGFLKDEFTFWQKIKAQSESLDELEMDDGHFETIQTIKLSVGEKIRFRSNDHTERYVKTFEAKGSYIRGVQNGTVGYIDSYDTKQGTMLVRLQDGRLVGFNTSSYAAIDYAYAITVNQSEGETYYKVSLYGDPLMKANAWLIGSTRHTNRFNAYVSKEHASDLKELVRMIGRSDYRPMIMDHILTDEQKPYFELVRNYKNEIELASSLIQKIMALEAAGRDLSHSPIRNEYQESCAKKGELAQGIAKSWDAASVFVQQAGINRVRVEIDAGLRKRLLSDVECEAMERVDLYQHIALKANALWEQITETHVGTMVKEHPLYEEFAMIRQQRNALAYDIATHAELHRPFMRTKTKEQDGVITYINYSGNSFDQKPPGLRATQTYAEHYIFSYNLPSPRQEDYLQLVTFKELQGQVASFYKQLKEAESIQVSPQVSIRLQEKLAQASHECDVLAYKIICDYDRYQGLIRPDKVADDDPRKYAIHLNETALLKHATYGELREAIQEYNNATTIEEYLIRGNRVYHLICGEEEQPVINKQLYGLSASLGVELSRLKFERGYQHYLNENKTELYPDLKDLKTAYEEIKPYREAHRQAADAWTVIKTTATQKIDDLQEAQIQSINKLSVTNLLDRQELLNNQLEQRGLKEANSDVFLAVNRHINTVVNGLHDQSNIAATQVNWAELKEEIKTQQNALNTLYPHLQKGRTSSYIGIHKESGLSSNWDMLRAEKLRLAPHIVKNHGQILQFAFPSDYKRMLKEAHEQERIEAVQSYQMASLQDKPQLAQNIMSWIKVEQAERLTFTRSAVQQFHLSLDGLKIFERMSSLSLEESQEISPKVDTYVQALERFSNLWKYYREQAEKGLLKDYIALHDDQATLVESLQQKSPNFNPHYLVQNLLRETAAELKAVTDAPNTQPAIEERLMQSIEQANGEYQWQLSPFEKEETKAQLILLNSAQNNYFEKVWGQIQELTKDDNPLIPAAFKRNEAAFGLMQEKAFEGLLESGEKTHALTQVHEYACRYALSPHTLKKAYEKDPDDFLTHPVGQFLQKELDKSRFGIPTHVIRLTEEEICQALQKAEIPPETLGLKPEIPLEVQNQHIGEHEKGASLLRDLLDTKKSLWHETNNQQPQYKLATKHQQTVVKQGLYDAEALKRMLTPSYIRSIYEANLLNMGVDPHKCQKTATHFQFGKEGKFHVRLSDGAWKYFKTSENGSIYSFLQKTQGLQFRDAVQWVGDKINAPKTLTIDKAEQKRQQELWQKKAEAEAEERQRIEDSKRLSRCEYNKSEPIAGTLAERYLREYRNYQGEIPSDIRFMPQISSKEKFPAVISFSRDKDGVMTGFQKILLDLQTGNKLAKREDLIIKRSGGSIKNTAVRIQEGEGVTYIAEGIETALSIKAAGVDGEILSGFGRMVFRSAPIRNQVVVFCADYDGIGAKTHEALAKDKEFLETKGYTVHVIWAATQGEKKIDFNDILKTEGAERIQNILKEQLPHIVSINPEHQLQQNLRNDENVYQKGQAEQITPALPAEPRSGRATDETSAIPEHRLSTHTLPDQNDKETLSAIELFKQELREKYPAEAQQTVDDWAQELKAKALRQPLSAELLQELKLNPQDVITRAGELLTTPGQKEAKRDFEILATHVVNDLKLFINVWIDDQRIGDKILECSKTKEQPQKPVEEALTAGTVIARMQLNLYQSENVKDKTLIHEAQRELTALVNHAVKDETLMFKIRLENKDIFNKIQTIVTDDANKKQNQQQVLNNETVRQRVRSMENG